MGHVGENGQGRVSAGPGEECGSWADMYPGTSLLKVDGQHELVRNAEFLPNSKLTESESAF